MERSGTGLIRRGTWLVSPLVRRHGVRDLRSGLLELVYGLAAYPGTRGLLLLLGCRISADRVATEMELARTTIRPGLLERIQVVRMAEQAEMVERLNAAGLDLDEVEFMTSALANQLRSRSTARVPQSAQDLVFEHVLNGYLLGAGPMTTDSIMAATGFSYPPVAKALATLDRYLVRRSGRRVELVRFPNQEWQRYVGMYERRRFALKFGAPDGMSRSPEHLLERFVRLGLSQVAVGGVHAARHYFPDLDLAGTPRLDLCVHVHGGDVESDLIERLDPALEPLDFEASNPAVVLWPVHRADPWFAEDESTPGLLWADPVGCLLALHDARLEPQALELVRALEGRL